MGRLQNKYKPGKLYKVIDNFILTNENAKTQTFTKPTYRSKKGDVYMLTKTILGSGAFLDGDSVWYRFFFLVGKNQLSALFFDDYDECEADFATCFVEWKE